MSNVPARAPAFATVAGGHEERVLRALRRIVRAIDLQSRRLEQEVGLTGPQLICLRVLAQRGPMTAGTLARAVDLSQATLTGILDRLVKRRLVTRRRSSKDRRRVTVALSPEGERLVETAPSPLQARFSARLAELPERTQARLCTTLEQVVRMMDAESLDAAAMLTPGPRVASGRHPAVRSEPPPGDSVLRAPARARARARRREARVRARRAAARRPWAEAAAVRADARPRPAAGR